MVLFLAVSFLVLAVLGAFYYWKKPVWPLAASLTVKACATLVTVAVCLAGILTSGRGGSTWLLLLGLCFCMAADIAIGVSLTAGMAVFLLAHLCFIVYDISLAPLHWGSAVVFVLFYALLLAVFHKSLAGVGKVLPLYLLYPAALLMMMSLSVMLPFSLQRPGAWLMALGAVCFAASDFFIACNTFGSYSRRRDGAVLALYFPAVWLLGASAFFM